ncbi:SRPBCC family protein [Thalassomonas haliotis]|uniref:SRPBCC family protein n=1 Tax=Thalassomonas haliotis TaxID=485448 RepID=A0ABY7V789_9GAMM|nr:SRPBCC family protein [Thalassomonas haliotis]WDE09543.1 SRPBCC family protein [Thalassomonas haliotis]
MKITKHVLIQRHPEDVWHTIAEQFDQAHKWMGIVENSYKVPGQSAVDGAPVAGRVCEFTKDPNGLKAEEKILSFSPEQMRFDFDVVPVNAPKLFPVKRNLVTMSVRKTSNSLSEVTWLSQIELSLFGYIVYPLLKRGLSKNFAGIMEDLKRYLEINNKAKDASLACSLKLQ